MEALSSASKNIFYLQEKEQKKRDKFEAGKIKHKFIKNENSLYKQNYQKDLLFHQFVIEKISSPYKQKIKIFMNNFNEKDEMKKNSIRLNKQDISQQMKIKLSEFGAHIEKEFLDSKGKEDISYMISFSDQKNAIGCYKYFKMRKFFYSNFLQGQKIVIFLKIEDNVMDKYVQEWETRKKDEIDEMQEKKKNERELKRKQRIEKQQKRNQQSEKIGKKLKEQSLKQKHFEQFMTTDHTFKNEKYEKALQDGHVCCEEKDKIEILNQLDPEEIEGDVDEDFRDTISCMICMLVVNDPLECPQCFKLFCSQCISQFNFKCPQRCNNQQKINFNQQINIEVKQSIEQVVFKCPYDDKCKVKAPYQKALSHLSTCKMIQVPCPNKCGLWVAKKDIQNHSQFLCKNTEVKCENCEVLEKPYPHESFKHNCFSILMKKVKALENK